MTNKVYFPVESLVGLGHFNRTGKLVREMVRNGLDVTVASGTFVDPARFFAGAKLTEMPGYVFKGGPGIFYTLGKDGQRTILADYNEQSYKSIRTQKHLANITALKPDVFVSEFWPFDRPNLDLEMKSILQALPEKTLRIVSVRDILHAPETAVNADERKHELPLREKWTVDIINQYYDAVLVHGDQNFIPLSDTFKALGDIKKPIIYTGYVIDDLPGRSATDPDAPFLVSCGSGAAGADMIFSTLAAWQKLLDRSRAGDTGAARVTTRPLQIICGPRLAQKDFDEINSWAEHLREKYGQQSTVERYRPDYTSLLANAAFSVSLAGYNTTLETLAIGVPSLFIPNYALIEGQIKMMSEQVYRLMRLEKKGLATYTHPRDAQNSSIFADILVKEFIRQAKDERPKAQLDFEGAANTMEIVSQLQAQKKAALKLG